MIFVHMMQVQLAEAFERFWGRFGDRHLCVSKAMKHELQKNWRIQPTVFYDRPPAQFEPTPLEQKVQTRACHRRIETRLRSRKVLGDNSAHSLEGSF